MGIAMPKKPIHYQHPKFSRGYHACGMGDRLTIQITDDITQVTCKRCLGTATGQVRSGRPPKNGQTKESTNTRIDPTLKRLAREARINLSELLEDAIRQKLNI